MKNPRKQTTKPPASVSVTVKAGKTDNETASISICHSRNRENRQRNRQHQYLSQQKQRKQTTKSPVSVSVTVKAGKTDIEMINPNVVWYPESQFSTREVTKKPKESRAGCGNKKNC